MGKKEIILVTWFGSVATGSNYGTSLQSFALQKKLIDLGYDAIILPERQESDFDTLKVRPEYFLWLIVSCNPFVLLKQFFQKLYCIFRKKLPPKNDKPQTDYNKNKFLEWEHAHYKVARCSCRNEWKRLVKSASCFIAGSNQIWNTYNHYNPYWFLCFAKGKKISYASSIGTTTINPKFREKVRKHLIGFSHISVREHNAVEELRKLTGREDVAHVLDPTLLLSKGEWSKVADAVPLAINLPSRYLLCYVLSHDKKYEDQVVAVAQRYCVDSIVIVNSVENPMFNVENSIRYGYATPSEFIALIRDSTVICTDSFHGTVFSIIFGKEFVEFKRFGDGDPKSQNSRIYELLEGIGLSERFYSKQSMSWGTAIDYPPIWAKIDIERESSLRYLVGAIEN